MGECSTQTLSPEAWPINQDPSDLVFYRLSRARDPNPVYKVCIYISIICHSWTVVHECFITSFVVCSRGCSMYFRPAGE